MSSPTISSRIPSLSIKTAPDAHSKNATASSSQGSRSESPHNAATRNMMKTPPPIHTPGSAIIQVPPGWGDSPLASGAVSRNSFDLERAAGLGRSFPMSATSSSSSSQHFQWPSHDNQETGRYRYDEPEVDPSIPRPDPFDNTSSFAEDPFAQPSGASSSSEDDRGSRQNSFAEESSGQRANAPDVSNTGPHVPHSRLASDPIIQHDSLRHPMDAEYSGIGLGPPVEGFQFDPQHGDQHLQHDAPPVFQRTYSAPLPSRLGSLRHPMSPMAEDRAANSSRSFFAAGLASATRPSPSVGGLSNTTTLADHSPASEVLETPLQTMSLELADSLQSAIQTLLHLSPPHLLDNAKEQYSGCTVQLPTTSLSALLTSMKSLNYLSANVQALCMAERSKAAVGHVGAQDEGILDRATVPKKSEDFDIGELLQSVADLLAGQASQLGVDLVLFHGDVGIKHVSVNGDNEGLAYVLAHVVRQILGVAQTGDTIELGLQIVPQSPSRTPRNPLPNTDEQSRYPSTANSRSGSVSSVATSASEALNYGPLLCVFEIVHHVFQVADSAAATPRAELNPFTRLDQQAKADKPKLDSLLCRRLLQHQGAVLKQDVAPTSPPVSGMLRRAYELSVVLDRGAPIVEPTPLTVEEEAIRQPFSTLKLAREPTLAELTEFAESLRGKEVVLHASLLSLFARHLTSYLASWGMEISHIPIEEGEDPFSQPDRPQSLGQQAVSSLQVSPVTGSSATDLSSGMANLSLNTSGPVKGEKFIIIDDDVDVLRKELIRIRAEVGSYFAKPKLLKRPTLLGRTRSTPQIRQAQTGSARLGTVLIHFTSLANYNRVRELVSSLLGAPAAAGSGAFAHPEVMVIPKPVGPRRFLTALHTAVNQPVVDPFFSPIATSPRSPGGGYFSGAVRTPSALDLPSGGFFESVAEEMGEGEGARDRPPDGSVGSASGSQKARSPLGEYPPTILAHQGRSDSGLHLAIPTPLVATPASEYFSQATKTGASGIVMQSPDGRPLGMFFEPPAKFERRISNQRVPSDGRRKISSRRTSGSLGGSAGAGDGEPLAPSSAATSPSATVRRSTPAMTPSSASGEKSAAGDSLSRRSSGRTDKMREDISRVVAARRKTLPTPQGEPIVAQGREGRERSTTITQNSGLSRKPSTKGPSGSGANSAQATSPVTTLPKPLTPADGDGSGSPTLAKTPKVKKAPAATGSFATGAATKKKKEAVVVPPINVLIVEDNPINQEILSMFLKKKRIQHQSAKDGLEAVEKWKTGNFHLILMDIQLPIMDGKAATKVIRDLERQKNVGIQPQTPLSEQNLDLHQAAQLGASQGGAPGQPAASQGGVRARIPQSPHRSAVIIVALTASSLSTDREDALRAGCNDFLTKPVSLKWLERKIVEWGSMQALIDFEGWQKWKASDMRDTHDTKRAFQSGPQAAAKSLASRLHIDRKPARSSTTMTTSSTMSNLSTTSSGLSGESGQSGHSAQTGQSGQSGQSSLSNEGTPRQASSALPAVPQPAGTASTELVAVDDTEVKGVDSFEARNEADVREDDKIKARIMQESATGGPSNATTPAEDLKSARANLRDKSSAAAAASGGGGKDVAHGVQSPPLDLTQPPQALQAGASLKRDEPSASQSGKPLVDEPVSST